MIPKIIHYCWFGGNELSDIAKMCIETWKNKSPDFKIKRWDEKNSPINNCAFVKKAYKNKKWAYVADYVRFYALFNEGGIYLDTDMLVIKNLKKLLTHKLFLGFESNNHEKSVNGAIIGSVANHFFIKNCLNDYENRKFDHKHPISIPHILTNELIKAGLTTHNKDQVILNEIKLYNSQVFYPYPFCYEEKKQYKKYITNETFAVHLWDYSWQNGLGYLKKRNYKKGFYYVKKTIASNPFQELNYYKKVILHILRFIKMKLFSNEKLYKKK